MYYRYTEPTLRAKRAGTKTIAGVWSRMGSSLLHAFSIERSAVRFGV